MKPIYLTVLLLLLLSASCTVYREYNIEVYKPGEINVPAGFENAALVYRNFKYPGDTLQNFYRKGAHLVKANTTQNLDSLLVNACLNELAFHLKNQNVFSEVLIFPYPTFERHTEDRLTDLPAEVTSQLLTDSDADVLISLESYSTFFSTYPETDRAPLTNEVVTVAVWGVYMPETNLQVMRKTMIDTIYWNGFDAEGNLQTGYSPPPRAEALDIASVMAGESFAANFFASWQTVKRMYSIPPLPDFSDAAFYLTEGKWDEAIFLYKKYAHERNGKMAINARYNLALAYEMKDELETALQWLTSAQELARSYRSRNDQQMIRLYQKELGERQNDLSALEKSKNISRP